MSNFSQSVSRAMYEALKAWVAWMDGDEKPPKGKTAIQYEDAMLEAMKKAVLQAEYSAK